jgi:hypothetical protein
MKIVHISPSFRKKPHQTVGLFWSIVQALGLTY